MTDDMQREDFERWARKHYLNLRSWFEPPRGVLPNDYMNI